MIARMWHGKVPAEKTSDYHGFLLKTGLKDYGNTPGNKGVFLLKKDDGSVTHFYTLTFWEDIGSIRQFAGEDYEKARYYPEDKEYLLEFEPTVTHFDVLESPDAFARVMKNIL
jgi:heme-degrading monooxygenase HmoA